MTHLVGVQQFRLLSNAEDLDKVFENRLRSVKGMVAMLDSWENPVYVTRIWCKRIVTAHWLYIDCMLVSGFDRCF